jgi:hypothetical protein
MRASETRLQHVANFFTIGTGVAYVWTKYFFHSSDPYSNAGSPWEPLSHNSHVVVVPLLVFACGVIWRSHILPKWQSVRNSTHVIRKTASGLGLLNSSLGRRNVEKSLGGCPSRDERSLDHQLCRSLALAKIA